VILLASSLVLESPALFRAVPKETLFINFINLCDRNDEMRADFARRGNGNILDIHIEIVAGLTE